ncbi:hypothetical protein J0H58_27680 [bacterium]|nr:hypothetical protein [bacterium]
MPDDVCVYCGRDKHLHGESDAGPGWVECPDGTGRAVAVDSHFRRGGPATTCDRCGHVQPLPHAIARHLGGRGK